MQSWLTTASTEFHRSHSSIWLKKNGMRFCTPTLRKVREGWGTPCPHCVGEIRSQGLGHPSTPCPNCVGEIRSQGLGHSSIPPYFAKYAKEGGAPWALLVTPRRSNPGEQECSPYTDDYGASFSVWRWRTSCQRWSSGSLLKGGIPRSGFPLVIFQKRLPSVWDWTSGIVKLAAFLRPEPVGLWHSAQCRWKSFAPPAAAFLFSARGFLRVAAWSGARQVGSCL